MDTFPSTSTAQPSAALACQSDARASSSTPYTDLIKSKKQTDHVKRPLNPFMLWSKQERPKLCEGEDRPDQRTISSVLGKMWKKLSEGERQKWKLKSDEAAVLHKIQYPDYQYKPRRKTKKRTLEYLQLIIHTDDTSSTPPTSPDLLNPPVSPLPSLCHDFNTIRTNDVQEIDGIELFDDLSSCAIDIDNLDMIKGLLTGEPVILDTCRG